MWTRRRKMWTWSKEIFLRPLRNRRMGLWTWFDTLEGIFLSLLVLTFTMVGIHSITQEWKAAFFLGLSVTGIELTLLAILRVLVEIRFATRRL